MFAINEGEGGMVMDPQREISLLNAKHCYVGSVTLNSHKLGWSRGRGSVSRGTGSERRARLLECQPASATAAAGASTRSAAAAAARYSHTVTSRPWLYFDACLYCKTAYDTREYHFRYLSRFWFIPSK